MKSILVIIVSLLIPFALNAQKPQDPLLLETAPVDEQVSISLASLTKLKTEHKDAITLIKKLQSKNATLKMSNDSISANLKQEESENTAFNTEIKSYREHIKITDKRLINITSNFLYIPYEAYSIKNIAIPAYKAIFDDTLKQKHQIEYKLLNNYQNDVKSLTEFLKTAQLDLSKPFRNHDDAIKWKQKFEKQDFFKDYSQYNHPDTYLGKLFIEVQSRLTDSENKSKEPIFSDIITKLNKCIKTIEELK